jgi:WD40 repeat protein
VTSLAFSPGEALLASASADHTVRLWDASSQKLNSLLIGHDDQVLAVAFSPDGKSLASGSADHTIALWQVASRLVGESSQDWLARACELAGRNLTRAEWGQYLPDQAYHKTCDQWPDGR